MIGFAELNGLLLAAPQDEPSGLTAILQSPLLLVVIIAALFYFMMVRPERQRRAELAKTLENLKKNDRVVTIGGIMGTVVNVQKGSEEITIKVDESSNTKLRVLRSAISRVVVSDEESQ